MNSLKKTTISYGKLRFRDQNNIKSTGPELKVRENHRKTIGKLELGTRCRRPPVELVQPPAQS